MDTSSQIEAEQPIITITQLTYEGSSLLQIPPESKVVRNLPTFKSSSKSLRSLKSLTMNQMSSARSAQTPMNYFSSQKVHHNTGLSRDIFQTEDQIIEGFWMQGEVASFLTLDEQKQLYLELFGFDTEEIFSICNKIHLGDLSKSY